MTPSSLSRCSPSVRLALIVLLLLLLVAAAPAAQAQARIRVLEEKQDYTFSQSLRFDIQVESSSPVIEARLYYSIVGKPLARRIYPKLDKSATSSAGSSGVYRLKISHVEELEPGQYPPGTRMRSWWYLRSQDGAQLVTETRTWEYADRNQEWRTLTGPQVTLFWYGQEEKRAQALLQEANQALDRLQAEIGVPAEKPIKIYVYNNQSDMRRALSSRSEGYDERVTTLGVAMGEDTLLLLGSHRDAPLTIAHELSHIVVNLATDNPYTELPRWLSEGLAMYAEGKLPEDNQRALDRAIRNNTLFSIRSMTSYSGRASEVDLFYGEAYSVVSYMLKQLRSDGIKQLLGVLRQGARQEDALQRVYGMGLDELDTRWRASLGLGPRVRPTPRKSGLSEPFAASRPPSASPLYLWPAA